MVRKVREGKFGVIISRVSTKEFEDSKIKFLVELAKSSDFVGKSKHASCVVYKNRIIGYGTNQLKSHPIMLDFFPEEKIFLHAEISSIIHSINNCGIEILKKSDLYVIRLGRKDKILNSDPCEGCMRAIKFYDLKKVIHS